MNGRQPDFDGGLWSAEMLRRCWRAASSGRVGLYLSGNGRSWEVELRQAGTEELSLRWNCGSQAEGQRLVETAVTANARWWPG
jgi:hypothetical protein